MHRRNLLAQLEAHRTFDAAEEEARRRMLQFVATHDRCFDRGLSAGHVTGSAWLVDASGERVLLTHHRKLNKWLQLGGHADGEPDVLAVALREAREESGLECIEPVSDRVFDVDVHEIPARDGEEKHLHYDVRYLLRVAGSDRFRVSCESHDLAWVSKDELPGLDTDESVQRMHAKWITGWLP